MVTARIAGLSPGTSPPPVRIPITPLLVFMRPLCCFLRAFKRKSTEPIRCARGIAASPRQLSLSTTDSLNDFADCIDHQFRVFLMYFVAAIRVGNMLFVGHKLGEPFLCFLLCGIGDIAEVRRDIGW